MSATSRGRGSKGREPAPQEGERQELELGEEIRETEHQAERIGNVLIANETEYLKLKIPEYEDTQITDQCWYTRSLGCCDSNKEPSLVFHIPNYRP